MNLDALLFDIDGTLVDSNPAHVEAWTIAFARRGHRIEPDRIWPEIGKGGDHLVPDILGERVDARDGDSLRSAESEEFQRIARERGLRPFRGARELLVEARRRGLRVALATSSGPDQLDALFAAVGEDFRDLADVTTTKEDVAESKPSGDVVAAAVRRLGVPADRCAMIGDTPYDAIAAGRAGVVTLAVRTGGFPDEALVDAGALGVWDDVAALLADLDAALRLAAAGGRTTAPGAA
jgi:membrane protein